MSAVETLKGYGMNRIGRVEMPDAATFRVVVEQPEAARWERAIYAFVVGDEIVRVGSSKGLLGGRLNSWTRDVSKAFRGDFGSTGEEEAAKWRACLTLHKGGLVFARVGTVVTTPVGTFPVYKDEESVLIGRHKPRMNNSKDR